MLDRLRKRYLEIVKIDFFGAPGREAVEGLLGGLEELVGEMPAKMRKMRGTAGRRFELAELKGRVWVTRKGVHVDRIASAWMVRRFVDPEASFKFVENRGYQPLENELRFDMFDAEFTHDGDLCTFEVLLCELALGDPALVPIAEIVHDIDLKETKFGRPEVSGIDHLIAGIARAAREDETRLAHGFVVFDGLYGYFSRRRESRSESQR